MARRDYYNDPSAPRANSIVVAVTAAVRDGAGRLLILERTDNGLCALPGGAQDIGESATDAVRREVQEETGIQVEVTGLSGVYSDPMHVIAYDDGEVRQEFSLCFHTRPTGGVLRDSNESRHVRWVAPADVDHLEIHPSMRLRIEHALADHSEPYLG